MYIFGYKLINILLFDHLSSFCIFWKKFHDPLEVLHDPLLGRDPSVEKPWSKGITLSGFNCNLFYRIRYWANFKLWFFRKWDENKMCLKLFSNFHDLLSQKHPISLSNVEDKTCLVTKFSFLSPVNENMHSVH